VLYDLGPKDRQQLILTKLFSSPPLNVQPYFMHFVFAAEDHAGVFDEYAGTQMQRWHLDPETRTFSEDWNSGDHSHAWGGTPLIQMSARILGVTPASAGYRRVAIQPHLCGLDWAKGVVPTPMGDVRVSWTNKDALFTLEITTPQEMDAEVILPQLPFANGILVIDGKQSASSAGAYSKQRLALAGGTHRITIEGQVSSR
jgi:alpha-L-rhamnosidase